MKKIVLVLFVLLYINSFGFDSNISYTENGFRFELLNFKYSADSNKLVIEDKNFNFFNFESNTLKFRFAVPDRNVSIQNFDCEFQNNSIHISENTRISSIINIKFLGKSAGLIIYETSINPYFFVTKDKLSSCSFDIRFDSNNKLNLQNNKNKNPLYSSLVNQMQLSSLLDKVQIENIPQLLEKNWFDSKYDYIKIEVLDDGVTKILMNEIISLQPQWFGKNSKDLSIIFKGNSYPFYLRDDDTRISNDDEIYFYGKRPVGDTTWYDNFAPKEVFYLTNNTDITPNNLIQFDESQSFEQISEKVDFSKHLEYDLVYEYGNDNEEQHVNSASAPGEQWYWDEIYPITDIWGANQANEQFNFNMPLFPTGNDEIEVKVKYKSIKDYILAKDNSGIHIPAYYDLKMNLNTITSARDSFVGYRDTEIISSLSSNNILFGKNALQLISKEVYPQANSKIGIDYVTISGSMTPFAYHGKLDFNANFEKNTQIFIKGFSSKSIVLIDTANSKIKFYTGNSGNSFIGGIRSGENPIVSLGINDSIIYSQNAGYHLFYRLQSNPEIANYIFSKSYSIEFENTLSSISDGDNFIFAYNGNEVFNSNIKSTLNKLGLNKINSISSGQSYIAAFQSGNKYKELISNTAIIGNINEFFDISSGKSFSLKINLPVGNVNYLLNDASNFEKVVLSNTHKVSLKENLTQCDAIFISHANFIEQAKRLAEYRAKSQDLKISVVDVEDIYKEFANGQKSPYGIKEFIRFTQTNYPKLSPKYFLLVGDASLDAKKHLKNSISENYIPVWGSPVSDFWYTLLDDDDLADVILSRIPADTDEEMSNIVNKLISYDTLSPKPWMKNFLFLTGGLDPNEIRQIGTIPEDYFYDYIALRPICGTLTHVQKLPSFGSNSNQASEIITQLNKGALWNCYIGHGAAEIFDMDGWFAENLNNKDRYFVLSTISCNSGAFAEPLLINCRGESYLKKSESGAIATLSNSYVGYFETTRYLNKYMMNSISNMDLKLRKLGDILYYAKARMDLTYLPSIHTVYQYNLLGDPLTRIRIANKTDLYFLTQEMKFQTQEGKTQFVEEDDKVIITGSFYNYGIFGDKPFKLRFTRSFGGKTDTLIQQYNDICSIDNFAFEIPIRNMTGNHSIELILDPDNVLDDDDLENNIYNFSFTVYKQGVIPFDPQSNWNINATNPKFRVINPFGNDNFYYIAQLSKNQEPESGSLVKHDSRQNEKNFTIEENYIDWTPEIKLDESFKYYFSIKTIGKQDSKESDWITMPVITKDIVPEKVSLKINRLNELDTKFSKNIIMNNSSQFVVQDSVINFEITSFSGAPQRWPFSKMKLNDEVVFFEQWTEGFNVILLKNSKSDTSLRKFYYKAYGTDTTSVDPDRFYLDTQMVKFIHFLRDSVQDDDYILISSSGTAWRMASLYQNSKDSTKREGSLDTLRYYLRQYGCTILDTMQLNPSDVGRDVSFAMVGWKGAKPGSIIEKKLRNSDTVVINGQFIKFGDSSKIRTSIIGPGLSWDKFQLDGFTDYDNYNSKISIFGFNDLGSNPELINESNNESTIDLAKIPFKKYKYIYSDIDISRKFAGTNARNLSGKSYINSLNLEFTPVPEIVISKKNTALENNKELRGFDGILDYQIQNISLRTPTSKTQLMVNIQKSGLYDNFNLIDIPSINPNSSFNNKFNIITDQLDEFNVVKISVDNKKESGEIYSFNNDYSLSLNIKKDTIKPTCQLLVDGIEIENNAYIQIQPQIDVLLFDNSPLILTDSTKIKVRINGYLHPGDKTHNFKFEKYNNLTGLKAKISFYIDSMIYPDASFIVYYEDSESNRDTLERYAKVSLVNAYLDSIKVYPNPFENNIKMSVFYKAPVNGGKVNVDVYDELGGFISSFSKEVKIGYNLLEWDGKTKNNETLSPGLYFFRINYEGNFYIDPQFIKVQKIN